MCGTCHIPKHSSVFYFSFFSSSHDCCRQVWQTPSLPMISTETVFQFELFFLARMLQFKPPFRGLVHIFQLIQDPICLWLTVSCPPATASPIKNCFLFFLSLVFFSLSTHRKDILAFFCDVMSHSWWVSTWVS